MIIAATDAAAQRKEAMAQGAYDGRFAPKIVGNKKAKIDKKLARKKFAYHRVSISK